MNKPKAITINHLLGELEEKCNSRGSTIESYEAIALLTEIVKLQQKEIAAFHSQYPQSDVKNLLPKTIQWELEYHNWWGKGAYRIFLGTEEECRGEQDSVEAAGWNMYCQGYGPSEAITIYIGPRRELTYDLFNFSQKILKDSSPEAYAKWEKDYEEYTLTDQSQVVGCGFGPDPRDYM